jgi:ketosteroid isomerase-like protein
MNQIAITANRSFETDLCGERTPMRILESTLQALSEARTSDVIRQFDECFTFTDHGLDLEFNHRTRLIEFFEKARELFPDTVVEVLSTCEAGDQAIAEWKITAMETVRYGSLPLRRPVSFRGVSVARLRNGKIAEWSDYYDQLCSRRVNLAAYFTEWVEL